jgi:hypothetical protein
MLYNDYEVANLFMRVLLLLIFSKSYSPTEASMLILQRILMFTRP